MHNKREPSVERQEATGTHTYKLAPKQLEKLSKSLPYSRGPNIKMRLIWLLFAAISIEYLQAASIGFTLNSSYANHHQPNHSFRNDSNRNPEPSEALTIISGKFVILATGDQIKLYPFKQTSSAQEDHILDTNYYLIQPRQVLDEPCEETYSRLGQNTLTTWMCSKSKQLNGTKPHSASISIIPGQQAVASHDNRPDHWKEPFVADVDYFFNSSYCALGHDKQRLYYDTTADDTDSSCLVVVWLDTRNNYVRYGSLDLRTALEEHRNPSPLTSKNHREQILWLREYPAFDLFSMVTYRHVGKFTLKAFGMVVDKRRQRLHVALSTQTKAYPNLVVSAGFRKENLHWFLFDSGMLRKTSFNNEQCSVKPVSDDNYPGLKNLNVDPETGDWLFYLDKRRTSSRISALGFIRKPRFPLVTYTAIQTSVRDIQVSENTPLGIAIDSHRRRLYWLSTTRDLYECNYAGEEARLIGKLSPKPAIRSIQSMQVLDGILYLSDPIKKSLIAYKLDRNNTEQEVIVPFPTHQVLLVEMSNILGFRLIKLNSPDYRPPDQEQSLSKYLKILDPREQERFTKIIKSLFSNQTNDEYDDIVEKFRIQQPICSSNWFVENKCEELRKIYQTIDFEYWVLQFASIIACLILLVFVRVILRRFPRKHESQTCHDASGRKPSS